MACPTEGAIVAGDLPLEGLPELEELTDGEESDFDPDAAMEDLNVLKQELANGTLSASQITGLLASVTSLHSLLVSRAAHLRQQTGTVTECMTPTSPPVVINQWATTNSSPSISTPSFTVRKFQCASRAPTPRSQCLSCLASTVPSTTVPLPLPPPGSQ